MHTSKFVNCTTSVRICVDSGVRTLVVNADWGCRFFGYDVLFGSFQIGRECLMPCEIVAPRLKICTTVSVNWPEPRDGILVGIIWELKSGALRGATRRYMVRIWWLCEPDVISRFLLVYNILNSRFVLFQFCNLKVQNYGFLSSIYMENCFPAAFHLDFPKRIVLVLCWEFGLHGLFILQGFPIPIDLSMFFVAVVRIDF